MSDEVNIKQEEAFREINAGRYHVSQNIVRARV